MATTAHTHVAADDHRAMGIIAGGAGMKTIGGIAVAVLAILAIIGLIPAVLTAIAGIVFGAAMLLEGISIGAEYNKIARWVADTEAERVEVSGGTGVEMLVGIAAIAMGILSLIGIAAPILIPALIITGGVGLILSAGTLQRLDDLRLITIGPTSVSARRVAHESMVGGTMSDVLGGIAAMVLGILSLVMIAPMAAEGMGILPQVGMLVLGVASAIAGGALTGKSTTLYRNT